MKITSKIYLLIALSICLASCNSQHKPNQDIKSKQEKKITIPENGFGSSFLDSKGILWFGSTKGGVYAYDGNTFLNYNKENGLCDNSITCIAEDSEGNILFGTTSGVCQYDGKNFSHLSIPKSDTSSIWLDEVYPVVNPNQVMSIKEDKHGDLWVGTNGAGVYRYDGRNFSQFLSNIGMVYEDGLYHNIVLCIIEDKEQNLWFSSLSHGGVSRYDGKNFTHFVEELSDDFVRVVHCDKKGNIWVGTHGNHAGGLDLFDGQKWTAFYKTEDGFSHNNVNSIFEDRQGNLWMGSGTTELSIFDGEKFKKFISSDGQTFDKMRFVIGDKQNNVWFGNNEGLWRFDGNEVVSITK